MAGGQWAGLSSNVLFRMNFKIACELSSKNTKHRGGPPEDLLGEAPERSGLQR